MYDLKEMKASISCVEVAQKYGIHLKQSGDQFWGKLRSEEKTASCKFDTKENYWYDFGQSEGGSVIDLVAKLENVDTKEAIKILAQEYGFEKEKVDGWRPLTNNQYKSIGIDPESAASNFKVAIETYNDRDLERWNKKYNIPVKDLAIKNPAMHNKMVYKIAMEQILGMRATYEDRVKTFNSPESNDITKAFVKKCAQDAVIEIKEKVNLLQRAINPAFSKKVDFSHLFKDLNPKIDFKEPERSQKETFKEKESSHDALAKKNKEKLTKIYKKLFDEDIGSFTSEQAKALFQVNKALTEGNKYLPLDGISKVYKTLGKNIDSIEQKYEKVKGTDKEAAYKVEMDKARNLFDKCSKVMDGIRESNMTLKNETAKQNMLQSVENGIEISP